MPRLISCDPGLASGWAYGHYDDETPYTLENVFVTHGGVEGVAEAYWNSGFLKCTDFLRLGSDDLEPFDSELIVERFVVRPNQPVDPVALEVIGFVRGVSELPIHWRLRSDKGKKGVMDAVLKAHGLWHTGSMVGHDDGRDVNDAIIHALTWLMFKVKHVPTIEKYAPRA